jgi:hypothetical protein
MAAQWNILNPSIIVTNPATEPRMDQSVTLPSRCRLAFLSGKTALRIWIQINVTIEAANCTRGRNSSAMMMANVWSLDLEDTTVKVTSATVKTLKHIQYHPTAQPSGGDFALADEPAAPINPPSECRQQQQQQQPQHKRPSPPRRRSGSCFSNPTAVCCSFFIRMFLALLRLRFPTGK